MTGWYVRTQAVQRVPELQLIDRSVRLVVMIYVGYPLSLRNVEDLLAEYGIEVSYEAAHVW